MVLEQDIKMMQSWVGKEEGEREAFETIIELMEARQVPHFGE